MSMRDILERESDGQVFDTAQVFLEGWDEIQSRFKVTLQGDSKYSDNSNPIILSANFQFNIEGLAD